MYKHWPLPSDEGVLQLPLTLIQNISWKLLWILNTVQFFLGCLLASDILSGTGNLSVILLDIR